MIQILLAVIALGASVLAAYSVYEAKILIEDLQTEIGIMKTQLDQINRTDLAMHKTDSKIFDILGKKIEQEKKDLFYLRQDHNHLRCVVMDKIQKEAEAENGEA